MKSLVIIESPYAGEIERNTLYACRAMLDSLDTGEAPIASHLLYTQMLDDNIPEHRALGIACGLAWRRVTDYAVFYMDYGMSSGMLEAKELYDKEGRGYVERFIGENPT